MIEAKNLLFCYGASGNVFKLTCESFCAQPSQITCIVGSNGSGKTTLLGILSGRLRPREGHVQVLGRSLRTFTKKEIRESISFIDASITDVLIDELLVVDHVALSLIASGKRLPIMPRRLNLSCMGIEANLGASLSQNLESLLPSRIAELSSGQRQAVAIALATLRDRTVMLTDEGTAHLDVRNARQFFRMMRDLCSLKSLACVIVTHNLLLAAEFADRVYILDSGCVSEVEFPVQDILESRIISIEKAFGLEQDYQ